MTKRVVLAGVVAAIAMFVWTSVAHMVLPLGTIGVKEITTNEGAVLGAMQANLGTASGLYLFPGMGLGPSPSMQQMRDAMPAYSKKLASTPSGLLLYHPPTATAVTMSTGQLLTEFATEFVEAFLVILLLAQARLGSFGSKLAFVAGIAAVASIATNVSYWNWYGFPGNYTIATIGIQFVGLLVAGIAGAGILGRGEAKARSAAA